MSPQPADCNASPKRAFSLEIGGGGAPTAPWAIGAIHAFEQTKIEISHITATSGGAPPGLLLAAGHKAKTLGPWFVEENFRKYLHRKHSWWKLARTELWRMFVARDLPPLGILGTEKLGELFDKLVPFWPQGFSISVTWAKESGNVPMFISSNGVFEGQKGKDGTYDYVLVANQPPPVSFVMRATIAIPIFLEPILVLIGGREMLWLDGGLADGPTNIGPHIKLLKQPRQSIIVLDTSRESNCDWFSRLMSFLQDRVYKYQCRYCYFPKPNEEDTRETLVIRPKVKKFASVRFGAGEFQKLETIIEGYESTMEKLDTVGLVPLAVRARADAFLAEVRSCARYSWGHPQAERARRMKLVLAKYDMYEPAKLE